MPRKTRSTVRTMLERGGHTGLAVKDGMRSARFTVKQGARRLAREVKSAAQSAARRAPAIGPISTLVEPLEAAARTTAKILQTADHAILDALSADGPYRAMSVPLRRSGTYFKDPAADLHAFTRDHYWRYRHWTELAGYRDLFVHELAIERIGEQVLASLDGDDAPAATVAELDARLILALGTDGILSLPLVSDEHAPPPAHQLAWQAAVATVLAGAIAAQAVTPKLATREALVLGDELATAGREGWERALRATDPVAALGTWLGFVLRHV